MINKDDLRPGDLIVDAVDDVWHVHEDGKIWCSEPGVRISFETANGVCGPFTYPLGYDPKQNDSSMKNAWTRDDLPHAQWLYDTFYDKSDSAMDAMERIACDLIDHLNAHHPKPELPAEWLEREFNNPDEQAQKMIAMDEARIEANIQRNRAIRERDAAVERADEWKQKAQRYINKFNRARNFNVEMKTRADIEKVLRECTNDVFASHAYPHMADAVCALFGIETEPADPVEAKAAEFYDLAGRVGDDIWAACRNIAAHVLGQEDRHVNQ